MARSRTNERPPNAKTDKDGGGLVCVAGLRKQGATAGNDLRPIKRRVPRYEISVRYRRSPLTMVGRVRYPFTSPSLPRRA